MRSGFGRKAVELRVLAGLSQTEFAEKAGWSLSRVSNIEYQRTSISDDVLRVYLRILKPTGADANDLRKLAQFSNSVHRNEKQDNPHPPLVALLEQFGKKLTPKSVAKIQEIIERETGETVSALRYSSNQTPTVALKAKRKRPVLSVSRLVEICLIASRFRRRFACETAKLPIELLLEKLTAEDDRFDYRISDVLPAKLEGAFACLIGEKNGHVLFIEENRFKSAEKGVYFCRHVIAHEIGHHILHDAELAADGELIFAPQELAKNSSKTIGSKEPIAQVVNSIIEVEAECFATFLLVPWEAFIKGTSVKYLADDFGEQIDEINRYHSYFKLDVVAEEFKRQLWQLGENSHPIFTHSPL